VTAEPGLSRKIGVWVARILSLDASLPWCWNAARTFYRRAGRALTGPAAVVADGHRSGDGQRRSRRHRRDRKRATPASPPAAAVLGTDTRKGRTRRLPPPSRREQLLDGDTGPSCRRRRRCDSQWRDALLPRSWGRVGPRCRLHAARRRNEPRWHSGSVSDTTRRRWRGQATGLSPVSGDALGGSAADQAAG